MRNMIHVEIYVFQSEGAQLSPVRLNRWFKITYENLYAVTSLLLVFSLCLNFPQNLNC